MSHYKSLISRTYQIKRERRWEKIYWAIDLHDTIITGKYNRNNDGSEIFPHAKEVLDFLFESKDNATILWTSSHNDSALGVLDRFNLKFNYFNENPECPNTDICNFSEKFYFNILLDDKAGFHGNDWKQIKEALEEEYRVKI